jgi:hypothetical protein
MSFVLITHINEEDVVCLKKMKLVQTHEELRRSNVNRKTFKIIWIYVAGLRVVERKAGSIYKIITFIKTR